MAEYIRSIVTFIDLGSLLRNDSDGLWHVDYLSLLKLHIPSNEGLIVVLKHHKRLIVTNLEDQISRGIRDKYLWLRDYHNWAVDRLSEQDLKPGGVSREELRVDLSDIAFKSEQ